MKIRATQADKGKGGYFVHPVRLPCHPYNEKTSFFLGYDLFWFYFYALSDVQKKNFRFNWSAVPGLTNRFFRNLSSHEIIIYLTTSLIEINNLCDKIQKMLCCMILKFHL